MAAVLPVSSFEIVFSRASGIYFEGEAIQGEVVVDLRDEMVIESLQITFRGTAVVQWPDDSSGLVASGRRRRRRSRFDADESTTDEEHYLNQMICLYSRETNPQTELGPRLLVSVGRHSYPFTIQLPENLPSSFRGDYGYLSYTANAVLERPLLSQIVVSKEFTIVSIVNLHTIDPEIMRPVHEEESESLGFCCIETGNVTCHWRLERRGFVPGEEIVINGEIHNNCNLRITSSKAALVQHTKYQGASGNVIYQRKQMTKLEKPEVPPGTTGFWRARMTVPPNLPQTGLKSCNIINLWYTLKLKVILMMHSPIETVINIVIGSNAVRHPADQNRLSASTDNSSRADSVTDTDTMYFV